MTKLPVNLTDEELAEFGREIDRVKYDILASRGASDALYIRTLIRVQRWMNAVGRLSIYASLPFCPVASFSISSWPLFTIVIGFGIATLALGKILENLEIAHNVMHGQWDWMHDPHINSASWEWDTHSVAEHWKQTHNVVHHTWTNVLGKDHDIGYGLFRMDPRQKWHLRHLFQPLINWVLMVFFEWGLALQSLQIEEVLDGSKKWVDVKPALAPLLRKILRQSLKDYVLFPALSGPFFPVVALANFASTVIRSIWANVVIFCGHFPDGVYVFTEEQVRDESRAEWYLRQLLGSCNFNGGRMMTVLAGGLNYQIEHHLFPDMPSNRYPEAGRRVEAIATKYGLPYHRDSLLRQYLRTQTKIWRLAMPGTTQKSPSDDTFQKVA